MGRPLNVSVPPSGTSSPAIRFIRVDLPVPEKPRMARNSPSATSRVMSRRTSARWMPEP